MCNRKEEKNTAWKVVILVAVIVGALAGITLTAVYFIKKFKLKLSMASPCDDCLSDDCSECEFAADFEDAPIDDVEVVNDNTADDAPQNDAE